MRTKTLARWCLVVVLAGFTIGSLFLPSLSVSAAGSSVPTPTATTLYVTVPVIWTDAMWFVIALWVVLLVYWIYRIFLGLIS